jgi:nucleoside-diphosphate-sugar epimerase
MKKILITGANGLIGNILVKNLVKYYKFKIFVLERNSNKLKIDGINLIEHDLTTPLPKNKIPKSIDYVIHLAAIAHGKNNKSTLKNNCLITQNIIDSVKSYNPIFIFFSTVSVYGEANRRYPIKTSDFCRPSSYYGKGKLKDEKNIQSNFKSYKILRLCPMLEGLKNKDLQKRVYFPKTKIKYKSPYLRAYSFSSHSSIFKSMQLIFNSSNFKSGIINVKNSVNIFENELLIKFTGITIYIPKSIMDFIFGVLKFFSFNSFIYHLNCNFWKMLKINTYE